MCEGPYYTLMSKGSKLLLEWRTAAKLTQLSAAHTLGIHPSEYNALERGKAGPSRSRAVVLRDVASVPIEAWDAPAQPETAAD